MEKSSGIILLYNQKAIIYDGKKLQSTDFKDTKKNFTSALIPIKYLNLFSYKISKDTSDDDIAIQTEIKMYNEGGLNSEKEYVIDYIKYDIGSEYLIEAFALSKDNFDAYFSEYASKVSALDMLFPRFLSYQALYDDNEGKNDLILYISEGESFATLYQKGRYIGYRSLNSIEEISKKTGIEVAKLKEYLQTKGLSQENYGLDEMHILDSVQGILLKDIEKIMYSLNQKRSLFGFDGIDRVFVDFEGYNIPGLEQFFVPYGYDSLSIDTLKYETNDKYGNISIVAKYLYQMHSIQKEDAGDYQSINLSFLLRKKPITKYLTFKYALVLTVTVVVCFTIYLYFETLLSQQRDKIRQRQIALKQEKAKAAKFKKKFIEFKKKYNDLQKTQKKIEDDIFVYENTLSAIPLIESEKYRRQKFMNDIVLTLKMYKLNALYIKQHDNKSLDIMLVSDSKKRDNIAKFMKELLKKGYQSATTKQIFLQKGIYKSQIRIEK